MLKCHARRDVDFGTSRVASNNTKYKVPQPNHFKIHIQPLASGVTACPLRLSRSDLGIAGGCTRLTAIVVGCTLLGAIPSSDVA